MACMGGERIRILGHNQDLPEEIGNPPAWESHGSLLSASSSEEVIAMWKS